MADRTREALGFIDNLEDFFLYDDRSRWAAIGWIIAVAGGLGTAELVFLGASVDDTVLSMGLIILIMSVVWIGWYCSFRPHQEVSFLPSRRSLMVQAITCILGLSLGTFLWRFQITTSERVLDRVAANPTNPKNIEEARKVLTSATASQVRIAPATLEVSGKKFVQASNENPEAWGAAVDFLNLKSVMNRAPKSLNYLEVSKMLINQYDTAAPPIFLWLDSEHTGWHLGRNLLEWTTSGKT